MEQKNKTHVRKLVGWLRYDTLQERKVIEDLYHNELRLYKNFFQPVMKLVSKERINGKIHKKYDRAKTPYHRVVESPEVPATKKRELRKIYESLNPAELKRAIDAKLDLLYKTYQQKNKSPKVEPKKKQRPATVSSFAAQPVLASVS